MTLTSGGTTVAISVLTSSVSVTPSPIRDTVGVTTSGSVKGSVASAVEWTVSFIAKCTASQLSDLSSFIVNTAGFKRNTFTLTPESSVDIGAGAGVGRTVRYWDGELPMQRQSYGITYAPLTFRVEV